MSAYALRPSAPSGHVTDLADFATDRDSHDDELLAVQWGICGEIDVACLAMLSGEQDPPELIALGGDLGEVVDDDCAVGRLRVRLW